ncbi:Uncharacterised protein [Escherichia coli]|uniref:Uncharacterized protein n=1 Tax=Escherichia coli TaxID=562 RepID=A0A376MXZ6_ECOLX|nr:Uncharacterised protein [Escherichia coli]
MSVSETRRWVAFLVTASGLTLVGIGSAFLGINCRRRLLRGVEFNRSQKPIIKRHLTMGRLELLFVNVKHSGIGRHVINNLFNIFESHWRTFVIQVLPSP